MFAMIRRRRLRTYSRSSTKLPRRCLRISLQGVSLCGRGPRDAARSPSESGKPSWILRRGDGLVDLGTHRAEVDLEGHAGCAKFHRQVLVVAEGLVLGEPAAAQGRPRQDLDCPILEAHLNIARDEQRPVANRRDLRALVLLRRAAIETAVLECAARASLDDLRDGVRVRLVGQNPGPPLQLEHAAVAAVDLTHLLHLTRALPTTWGGGPGRGAAWPGGGFKSRMPAGWAGNAPHLLSPLSSNCR